MPDSDSLLQFLSFLERSPSSWHAASEVAKRLTAQNFVFLDEKTPWHLQGGKKYFTIRNDASVCAFIMPHRAATKSVIIATHLDSPALKLKHNASYQKENAILFGLEMYGSPLLTSWLNRDLGIAGRVFHRENTTSKIRSSLVNLTHCPLIIPQLAIHLDRNANTQGVVVHKQEHLPAIAALTGDAVEPNSYLHNLLQEAAPDQQILASDLILYPLQEPACIGPQKEMLAAYRLDNLASAAACCTAIEHAKPHEEILQMALFFDSEEIGSETRQGAASPFFESVLGRIASHMNLSYEAAACMKNRSLCLSLDGAHGMHPNHVQTHEAQHLCLLGKGIVLKLHAQQRYATDGQTLALFKALCLQHAIAFQIYHHRTDMPCGSTIGPIFATKEGIATIDLGISLLSMHSCREIISTKDYFMLLHVLQVVLQNPADLFHV